MIQYLSDWMAGKPLYDRSGQWPRVRAEWLSIQSYCQLCLGKDHLEVHHKKPYHLFPELELNKSNFITLCEKNGCHFIVGHCRDWKAYNPYVLEDIAYLRNRIDNRLYTRGDYKNDCSPQAI